MGRRRHKHVFEPFENAIQAAIIEHWRLFGVEGSLVAAIPNAYAHGQAGLTSGLPDLIVVSPLLGRMTGFIELKTARGRLSEAQKDIGALLKARGAPYAVTYGRDEPIRILELWGAVSKMRVSDGVGDERPADPERGAAGAQAKRTRMAV